MTARAGVPLEDNVAPLVNGETVVLVHDDTILDCEVGGAAVEAVGVVSSSFAVASGVGLVTSSYAGR